MTKQVTSITKNQDFKNYLKQKILSMSYAPGDKLPSIRHMAKEHNISKTTVSIAISNLVTEGLLYCEHGRGVFVVRNIEKRYLPESDRIRIGLVYQDIYRTFIGGGIHPAVLPWVSSFESQFGAKHYSLNLFAYQKRHFWDDGQNRLKKEILAGHIDGLVITGPLQPNEVDNLNKEGIPFVLVCQEVEGRNTVSVGLDVDYSCRLLLSHLKEIGHERIGLITYTCGNETVRTIKAFEVISQEMSIISPCKNIILIENEDGKPDFAKIEQFFNLDPMPTAVILMDDFITNRFIMECLKREILIPNKLAFECIIDAQPTSHFIPTTRLNFDMVLQEITKNAIILLSKMIEGHFISPQTIYVKPELIICHSTVSKHVVTTSSDLAEPASPGKTETERGWK